MRKVLLVLVLLGLLALTLAGCSSTRRLGDLERKTADQATQIAALKGQVDSFPSMLQANSTRVSDLEKDASTYAAMIASNGTLIAELQKRVESYTSSNERTLASLGTLEREVGGYTAQIESLTSDVVGLRRQQDSQSALLASNTALIASRGEQVGEVERKLEQLVAAGQAATAGVEALRAMVETQTAQIEKIAAERTDPLAEVALLSSEVQSMSARVAASELAVATLQEALSEIAEGRSGLRVGTVDLLEAAGAFREAQTARVEETAALEGALSALETACRDGAIAPESCQTQGRKLRSDLLVSRLALEAETIGQLVASESAARLDLESTLGELGQVVQEIEKAARDLIAGASLDEEAFQSQLETLSTALEETDGELRSTLAPLVREAVRRVASEQGLDLILERGQLLVGDGERIVDVTDLVKEALRQRP